MIINPGAPLDSIRYEMYLGRRLSDRIFGSFLSDDGSLYFVTDPVVETLHHTSEEGDVYDGMDLSLITFDKKSMEIKYAGAYNSMYLVGKGKLQEVKADRQPIGLGGAKNKEFKTVVVDVQKGDMVYLFSDGYADQFGGAKLKKFKSANMKELLVNISGEKVDRQREILDESIEKWRGNIEQIDNILVIGRRF